MSFIKSDSLFSSVRNGQYPKELRPNDSTSNIFRSIFENLHPKPRSILVESLLDFDHSTNPVNQSLCLMDKLVTVGFKENNVNGFHYNWMVCKNGGCSEAEDNEDESTGKCSKPEENLEVKSGDCSQQESPKKEESQNEPLYEQRKIKNETKNIPKNYGKAIISFIEKNRTYIETITARYEVDYDDLLADLKKKKKTINTIADLRSVWSKYEYAKCMRVISSLFLRKHALQYIFDSRICTFASHIKYRQRLCEAVGNPEDFMHIKDY